MAEDLSNKVCCVVDHGSYTETAIRLAREFGEVLYYSPWQSSSPTFYPLVVGDGFSEITRVRSLWDVKNRVDLWVFPDLYFEDVQMELESQGKRVWGARRSEYYEYKRELFQKTLKDVGLPVAPMTVCIGVSALKDYLSKHGDKYVKLSLTRGDGETWRHKKYLLSAQKVAALYYYYGPFAEYQRFLVYDEIESDIEVGYDGPSVDGQFFDSMQGYERKNMAYIGTFMEYAKMPEAVRVVNEAFAPILKRERCRSMFGTEIRIDKKGDPYFIDATIRQPCPPGESQLEMFSNLGEVMWHGAAGHVVPIKPAAKFCAEVMVYSDWAARNWCPIEVPDKVRRWVKLFNPCRVDGAYYPVPDQPVDCPLGDGNNEIGAVVGIGDTIEKAIDEVIDHCSQVDGFDTDIQIAELAECLKSIKAGEEEGLKFAKEVPEPATVIDD